MWPYMLPVPHGTLSLALPLRGYRNVGHHEQGYYCMMDLSGSGLFGDRVAKNWAYEKGRYHDTDWKLPQNRKETCSVPNQ